MIAGNIDLRPALRARLQRFRTRLEKIQQDASIHHVHGFRIACRELLACYPLLKTTAPARRWRKPVRQSLKALNQLRDLQQMQERLQLTDILDKKRHKATRRWECYAPALHQPEFFLALQQSEQALANTADVPPEEILARAYRLWQRRLRQVEHRLHKAQAADLATLHRLRIRYKALRYLLELFHDSGMPLPEKPASLKSWQEMLGEVEDFRVMARLARQLELPAPLSREFLQHAQQQAEVCLAQREALAEFLAQLDNQVTQQMRGNTP